MLAMMMHTGRSWSVILPAIRAGRFTFKVGLQLEELASQVSHLLQYFKLYALPYGATSLRV